MTITSPCNGMRQQTLSLHLDTTSNLSCFPNEERSSRFSSRSVGPHYFRLDSIDFHPDDEEWSPSPGGWTLRWQEQDTPERCDRADCEGELGSDDHSTPQSI